MAEETNKQTPPRRKPRSGRPVRAKAAGAKANPATAASKPTAKAGSAPRNGKPRSGRPARAAAAKAATPKAAVRSDRPSAASRARKAATTTSATLAGAGLSEQIFKRVTESIESGKTARNAFQIVAKELGLTPANVQQRYYRLKRGLGESTRTTARRASRTVSRARPTARKASTSARTATRRNPSGVVSRAATVLAVGRGQTLVQDVASFGNDLRKMLLSDTDLAQRALDNGFAQRAMVVLQRGTSRLERNARKLDRNVKQLIK